MKKSKFILSLSMVALSLSLSLPAEAMWQTAKKSGRSSKKKQEQPREIEAGAEGKDSEVFEKGMVVSKPKEKKPGEGEFRFMEGRFDREDVPLYVNNWEDYKEFRINWITSHLTYQYPYGKKEMLNLSIRPILEPAQPLTDKFLLEVGEKLGSIPKVGKAPKVRNGATYFIQFIVFLPGVGVRVIDLSSGFTYVSGSRYFEDLAYKKQNRIKVASHDFLTEAEFSEYKESRELFKKTGNKKLTQVLGKMMEQKIRDEIVGGGWADNAADSEALMLLDIKRNMPAMLNALIKRVRAIYIAEYSEKIPNYRPDIKTVWINGVVFGFSSYYKNCWRCRNLIQGFQFKTREFLEGAAKETQLPFQVNEKLGTLAFFYGKHATVCNKADKDPYAAEIVRVTNPVQVQMGFHQFAEY